jgi:hypothetical protein
MQQFVTIFVVCGESGRQLFDESNLRLSANGFDWDRANTLKTDQLAFYCSFLDIWSMGDSFEKFFKPEGELKVIRSGSHQLVCSRREDIRIEGHAGNEEEKRLKQILEQAKEAYEDATSESYLFQLRSVFDASVGFNP